MNTKRYTLAQTFERRAEVAKLIWATVTAVKFLSPPVSHPAVLTGEITPNSPAIISLSPLPLPLTPLSTGGFQPRCQTRPALPATTTSNTSYSNTNHHLLLTIPPLPQRPQPPPALTPPPFTLLYYGSPLALASTAWLFFLGSFTPKNTQHHTQQHYRYTHT